MRSRRRSFIVDAVAVCLGLYMAVLLASPVLHHDLECHLKSPGHCQACVANPLAPAAQPTTGLGAARLLDFGRALVPQEARAEAGSQPQPSGRAPPR